MRPEDLELDELVEISKGNINLHGRRLVLHSINAFAQFREDILSMLGWDHARRLFTRFGFFCGQADAAALQRIFRWDNMSDWLRAGARMHELMGIVHATINEMRVDEVSGKLYLECTWRDSAEAEEHLMEIGPGNSTVCWKLTGYASGFATYCLGKSVYFLERSCRGKGDQVCQAVGMDGDSWGEEIGPHLPFFEAEDIKGTVENLTGQLRMKTEELEKHRQRIDLLQYNLASSFVEIRSKKMQEVLDLSGRVAHFDTSVLITGETGVGKEVLARYIHDASHRSKGLFVPVNCAALPETLLESELFGHKSGSFTGAVRDRIGLFEEASQGTIFLDEIGDISLTTQLKILRVLQEKEVLRIGENRPRKIDVRVIAATNQNLEKAVSDGRFREDLLYRLRVIEIEMPPLRTRPEDILPLARSLIKKIAKKLKLRRLRLDATCADILLAYPWPGNVRELENILERAAVLSREGIILPEHLPPQVVNQASLHAPHGGLYEGTLNDVELKYIQQVLEDVNGNRTMAAKKLGISAATLWRKLKEIE
ncbi:MAG: sigma-54-dependent Fis family transcriptional regulator [Candidatus Zixiibacteriota bacterium]|nr:MAG: sigma-54-dependent Fis family transcriptional regulator [candidate division Zixibacteria bacterium]